MVQFLACRTAEKMASAVPISTAGPKVSHRQAIASRRGARQGKPDEDADDEPLRAVAADEVEEIEDAAAETVHAPPPEPRWRGGVNADAS